MVDGLIELTLEVDDLDRASDFYERVIGLPRLTREADRVWLKVGDATRLGLWCPGEKEFGDRGGAHVHFALSVSRGELETLHGRIETCGIDVRGPVAHDGRDRSIYFTDPFGNASRPGPFSIPPVSDRMPSAAERPTRPTRATRIASQSASVVRGRAPTWPAGVCGIGSSGHSPTPPRVERCDTSSPSRFRPLSDTSPEVVGVC